MYFPSKNQYITTGLGPVVQNADFTSDNSVIALTTNTSEFNVHASCFNIILYINN